MTIKEFENKYWYMSELKALAKSLAIPFDSKMRKDRLEEMIIQFLETGTVNKKHGSRSKSRNIDILNNGMYVENFNNKKETWEFIHSEMDSRVPGLKPKSGAKYWLNRWIENKLQAFLPERNRISASCAPSETFSTLGGANIHIDVYNERNNNGITLVLFHGVGGNGRLLSFIAVPLARRGYKVVCPDLPGYGYTEYEGVPSYKTWIDTGVHIVRQELQRCEKLFVLGLSAGGMLAYNVACSAQGVCGVIVTTLLDNRLKPVREYSAKNKLHARFALPLLRFMPKRMRHLKIPVKAVTNMNAIVNDDRVLSLLLQDKRGAGSSVYLGFLCSMMESIPAVEPESFEIPLLLCHPEKDRWTPERISRLFFDRIRSAKELCTLKNAGHFPIEQPGIAQLEEAIISFINKTLKER